MIRDKKKSEEREEIILILRLGLYNNKPHTLKQIAEVYGVTRDRIRQIEAKALRKLRHPSRWNNPLIKDILKTHTTIRSRYFKWFKETMSEKIL